MEGRSLSAWSAPARAWWHTGRLVARSAVWLAAQDPFEQMALEPAPRRPCAKPVSAPARSSESAPLLLSSGFLALTQAGYELHAAAELAVEEREWATVPGAAMLDGAAGARALAAFHGLPPGGFCFPQVLAGEIAHLRAGSVNALARQLCDALLGWLRGERIEGPWPCVFRAASIEGLSAHASAVEAEFRKMLKERVARVAKLAEPDFPRGCWTGRGLLVFFPAKGEVVVARDLVCGGQRRMADDSGAPSRSYLKTEEAFVVLGTEPKTGETVVDLGAAPGGWSYSAAKRGASVVAVDNGPLKGGAANNPLITHLMADAFHYQASQPVDWLFCDLVEEPHHVWRLISSWLERGWCRRFVVNLKLGRADPNELLATLRDPDYGVPRWCGETWKVRHLLHDREELTLVGEVTV